MKYYLKLTESNIKNNYKYTSYNISKLPNGLKGLIRNSSKYAKLIKVNIDTDNKNSKFVCVIIDYPTKYSDDKVVTDINNRLEDYLLKLKNDNGYFTSLGIDYKDDYDPFTSSPRIIAVKY